MVSRPDLSLGFLDFGRGDVGFAVGEDHDVGLRGVDQQVCDIDEALEGREELEIHLDVFGADERRGAGGLEAMDDEVVDVGAEVASR